MPGSRDFFKLRSVEDGDERGHAEVNPNRDARSGQRLGTGTLELRRERQMRDASNRPSGRSPPLINFGTLAAASVISVACPLADELLLRLGPALRSEISRATVSSTACAGRSDSHAISACRFIPTAMGCNSLRQMNLRVA